MSLPLRVLVGAGLAAAAGFALGWLPLLEAPGWEAASLAALLAAALGGPVGLAAARRELARAAPSALRAFSVAVGALAAVQLGLLGGIALHTVLLTPCSPVAGLAFLPAVALPSALLAAALGTFAALAARGRAPGTAGIYLGLALASLAATLAEAYLGPAAYATDPLLGLWPGPLYDEALSVDRRVLLFRAGTLAWTVALVAAASWVTRWRSGGRRTALPAVVACAALAAVAGARLAGARTGDLATRASLDRVLGGRRTGDRCDLHFPREKPALAVERLLRACELDVAEVAAALGVDPPRVAVWLHRSEAEKRRLVGAGRTDFTKPWLRETQILDVAGVPPSLRHELTHLVAAARGAPPLGVPARLGLWVNMGLVEGVAVALELPRGEWTTHEWARAQRDLGLLPPASALVAPAGFFAAPPARAYAAAGSLVRFLLDRHGPAPLLRAYRGASLEEAYGVPLAGLERQWLAFLDDVAVPPALAAAAEARFRPAGLLGRRCAREVAGLERSAWDAQHQGRARDAARLWTEAARLTGDPEDLRRAGDALRSTDPAGARQAYGEAMARAGSGLPALRLAVHEALGEMAWRAGDAAGAARDWSDALALGPEPHAARRLQALLAMTRDPALSASVGPWLLDVPAGGDREAARRRLLSAPDPLSAYLAARADLAFGDGAGAPALLERSLAGPLPSPEIRLEALRLLARLRCDAGDGAGARAAWDEVARSAERAADRERSAAETRRCDEELRRFGPLRATAAGR